jgi:methyl-accepting chemotaxis protein
MSKNEKIPRFYARKFLVDPLQLKFAGQVAIHFAVTVLVFIGAIFLPTVVRLMSGNISDPYVQEAAHDFLTLHESVWMPMVGALLLIILHNIRLTHRVAGPLYRFRPYLEKVGSGDLSSSIRFRKKDHLKKEAEIATQMVEDLREKIDRAKRDLDWANEAWNDLRGSLSGTAPGDVQMKIAALSDSLEECRNSMSVFKTSDEVETAPEKADEAPAEEPALI